MVMNETSPGMVPCTNCGNPIWPESLPLCDACRTAGVPEPIVAVEGGPVGKLTTVAQLRAAAVARGVDLGDSTRKADIQQKLFDDMSVAELRAYADSADIDLGGASRKADIIAAIVDGPAKDDEEVAEEPASGGNSISNFFSGSEPPADSGSSQE